MNSLLEFLRDSTSILGLVSTVASLIQVIAYRIVQVRKLRLTEQMQFKKVLASDNIVELGKYLDDVVGDFNLFEYANSSAVRGRVDLFIEKVMLLVGTEDEIKQEFVQPPVRDRVTEGLFASPETDQLLDELRSGETWNALARLRRLIEIALRQIVNEHGLLLRRPETAGYMLEALLRKQVLPEDLVQRLRYAIAVCNKGVHGLAVELNQAEEAMVIGLRGLEQLEAIRTGGRR